MAGRFELAHPFYEQKINARPEAEQHHGNAGGDSPKRADGRAAIVAAAHDDVAWHGDDEFENAPAQQPAQTAFEQGIFIVGLREASENIRPHNPENGDSQ